MQGVCDHPDVPSFPTRRSSDLQRCGGYNRNSGTQREDSCEEIYCHRGRSEYRLSPGDRKSTRLNSSHVAISYAVFRLKKKKKMSRRQWSIRHAENMQKL